MMKTQNKKRGFTIIELVIVVTVIAILSAVLIPTFAGIIKKSRLSADQQAVRGINLELAAADDEDLANLESVEAYLESLGYTIENYKPVSKNYRLAYAPSLKKVVLVNDENKIVYPAEYANEAVTVEVAEGDEEKVITELNTADDIALVAMSRGGEVSIPTDGLEVDTAIYVTKNLTVNLTGNLSMPNDTIGDGVFCVTKGTLTLNGNGIVNGVGSNEKYNIAVWANGGNVVINGGTYTNTDRADAVDLLYVKHGGTITINGGIFKCAQHQWTLNSNDNQTGTFVVKGGEFYEFNPAEAKTEPGWSAGNYVNWVAEGYEVVEEVREDGTWYVVKPVQA